MSFRFTAITSACNEPKAVFNRDSQRKTLHIQILAGWLAGSKWDGWMDQSWMDGSKLDGGTYGSKLDGSKWDEWIKVG